MAKAHIDTASGTQISIEGTSEEIAKIISVVQQKDNLFSKSIDPKVLSAKKNINTKTATDLLIEAKEEGFFNSQRGLLEIKKMLDEKGYIYPITTLSPVLLRLARKRILRRTKEKGKRYVYVKGSG